MEAPAKRDVPFLLASVERAHAPLTIDLSWKPVFQLMLAVIAMFAALNIAFLLLIHVFGFDNPLLSSIFRRFDLDEEFNLPSWFTSSALLTSALILALIFLIERQHRHRYTVHWGALAVIFTYLSIDEAIRVHEWARLAFRPIIPQGSLFFGYSWMIAAAPLVLLFVSAYIRFFFNLPRHVQHLFFVAGLLYVGSALGLEIAALPIEVLFGFDTLPWKLISVVEETGELLGITVFIHALLTYLSVRNSTIYIALD